MKHSHSTLRSAVAAALALSSAGALAYVPTSNTDADVVLYWGGATASTLSAQELAVAAVCDTDPHLLYVKATSGTPIDRPGNDWALACKTAAAGATKTGLPNNKRILLIKRDRGGSGVGVGPVQTKATDTASGQISFLTVNGTTCNIAVTPGVNGAPGIVNPDGGLVPAIGCSATYTTNALTEMGTSDIEPDKFFGINTPIVDGVGLPFRTEPDRAFETQAALAALMFNNPVTLPLYRKLQEAQFPVSSVCNPANAGFGSLTTDEADRPDTTNAESEACMPSLTREELNSILTGRIVTWNQLLKSDGTAIPGLSGAIQICRRVDGSGTQATVNALVGSFPCDANLADGSINIITPRVPNGTTVIGNSGSGDVDNCLHNFATTANPYAIGNLSVEGRNNNLTRNWRFIKIDGVAPRLDRVHDGDYWFWAQQSCQLRGDQLPYNAAVGADDTVANKTSVFNSLCGGNSANGLNSIATLLKLNGETDPVGCANGTNLAGCGSNYTWGRSGWLATPTTATVYDNVLSATTRPVNAYTREVTPGRVNICQTPVKATIGTNATRGAVVAPNPTWTP
ncbi:MAG: hypothetical protein AB7V59_05315 [Gammaproteobacteria bacterium]